MSWSRRRFLSWTCTLLWGPAAAQAERLKSALWHTDYQRAQHLSLSQRRPLLVFVMSDSCPYCHKMLQGTYQEAGVAADYSEIYVLTLINATQQHALARRLGVRVYPTTFVVDVENQLVDRIEGYLPADKMRQRLALASSRLASREKTGRVE